MGVCRQRHAPAALPPEKTHHPLYRRRGGSQGRSGRVRRISPPPGFDPRTVQPVASRYTDWAIPAHESMLLVLIMNLVGFLCYFTFVMFSYVQHLVQLECASDISLRDVASYIWSWYLIFMVPFAGCSGKDSFIFYVTYIGSTVQYSTVQYCQKHSQLKKLRNCNMVFSVPTADCDFM